MDALDNHASSPVLLQQDHKIGDIESSLRQQMQADALQPISSGIEDDPDKATLPTFEWSSDTVEEALQYLRLNVRISPTPAIVFCQSNEAGTGPVIFAPRVSTRQVLVLFLVRNAVR
jgi:hypothetical protein